MTTALSEPFGTASATVLPSPLALIEQWADRQAQNAPEAPAEIPRPTSPRLSPTVVLDGFSVSITVRAGHLVLKAEGRELKLPRAHHGVQRVLVLSEAGFVSLNAIRWCRDQGIALIGLNPYDGQPTFSASVPSHDSPRLLRAQANLGPDAQLSIASRLIRERIAGQAANLDRFFPAARGERERVERAAEALDQATTVREVKAAEASAAKGYFAAWSGLVVRWARQDVERIPEHWKSYPGRHTGRSGLSARYATQPINALLNYTNGVAERLAVVACSAVGLHPDLGVLHADAPGSPGLALDLVETVRAETEAAVLEMVAGTVFTRSDFHEVRQGEVILRDGPTAALGQASAAWVSTLGHAAEDVAAVVGKVAAGKVVPRTPLTARRNAQRVATGSRRTVALPAPVLAGRCRECGGLDVFPAHPVCLACDPSPRCESPRCGVPLPPSAGSGVRRFCSERCGSVVRKARVRAGDAPPSKAEPGPCLCGCGETAKPGSLYVNKTHGARVQQRRARAANPPPVRVCAGGCGTVLAPHQKAWCGVPCRRRAQRKPLARVESCERCRGPIPSDLRPGTRFCSTYCRQTGWRETRRSEGRD